MTGVIDGQSRRVESSTTASVRADRPPRRFLDIPDGPRIAYIEAGSGPDLILVHGALMTLDDMWLGPMEALSRHFRVVAIDRPGHGDSEHVRLSDASVWRQAEIVRDVSRGLGLRRPVLVGHSFGGAVCLAFGMAYPDDTGGVVAISPICFPELRLEQVLFGPRASPMGGDALSRMLAGSDALLMPLLWRAMFLPQPMPARFSAEFPFGLAGQSRRLVADGENANMLWSDLSRSALGYATCRVPAAILCGSADIVTNPLLHGRQAARLIPDATFRWLHGLGHMLHHFEVDAVVGAALEIQRRSGDEA
ncbi:4,5:9,10-diseco-3-hydroxy-5,9, 17-trioxoandrosta-1(10),2-diene-4-oate hydrolase [Methylobacterium bullatum]|uniref:4,5:9,10-diseco-3-hydroxy-5,9, 17-trioxoandrosta-1(10),2-diene-4-oate hydrolase n=1 Tax=Methylobacterium bullatum TaxID=570505 RepID=A0A679IPK5_9HYPH|nr:4,5:9,10-diseco-3-hydroxy-5,9, 17-trioxoandrosta-1(10),2-diene-4-oate hydrolase [Methylobacterium bullatum]